MEALSTNAALIVVDAQMAINDPRWGERNNRTAESNIAELIAAWRETLRPIFHVHHRSQSREGLFHPERPGFAVKPEAKPQPGEPVIYKSVNSAFIGTDLEQRLRHSRIQTLVIVGFTTDHCVSTTTRMAGNLGFNTHIVSDATSTFERRGPDGVRYSAQQMHDTALASLHEEFALVVDTQRVLGSVPLAQAVVKQSG